MRKSIAAAKPRRSSMRMWLGATAAVALLVTMSVRQQELQRQHTFSELADLHVATLASANPVDVISTDRHTVKPWFQGKIPFTFNLPELQNSEFTLLGGRVTYLGQAPGAELIYQIRKHQISVFIFQDRAVGQALGSSLRSQKELSFNIESWNQDGLRYFVIGDASAEDIRNLTNLLKNAA
jgi:anti-sigma factor RsiW